METTEDYLSKLIGTTVKVVYADAGVEKAIRGEFVSKDDIFVILKTRRQEIIPIGKRNIIVVLPDNGGDF